MDVHKQLDPDNPDTAMALKSLVSLYVATGQYATAEPLQAEALEITKKRLDSASPALSERQQLAMISQLRNHLDVYLA